MINIIIIAASKLAGLHEAEVKVSITTHPQQQQQQHQLYNRETVSDSLALQLFGSQKVAVRRQEQFIFFLGKV